LNDFVICHLTGIVHRDCSDTADYFRQRSRNIRLLWNALPPNSRGALFILAATLFVSLQGVGIKSLSDDLHWLQIALLRSVLLTLFVLPLVFRHGRMKTKRLGLHFMRGAIGISAMCGMVYALVNAPLADVTTISFTRSLFIVLLSIFILKEVVRWRRWTALLVGFAGVVMMVKPGAGDFNPALLSALFAAAFGAVIVIIIKRLSRTEHSDTIVFYFGMFSISLTAIPAAFVWQWPSTDVWVVIVAASLAGTGAQLCFVRGWAAGEASALAPVAYSQIIWATLFGFFFFSEVPTIMTIAGAAVIVASTLYIAMRDTRLKRAVAVPVNPPTE
jgi:drug/metabolite transporter (DMT)-like permease